MKYSCKMLLAISLLLFISIHGSAQLSQPINFQLPSNIAAANVTAAECFFDKDPGFGMGSNIAVAMGKDVSVNNFSAEIDTLSAGVHRFYTRTKNSSGDWSQTSISTFFIIPPGTLFPPKTNSANITAAECFFDMDPGFGKGSVIPVTNGADVSVSNFALEIDTLSLGAHRFYVRTKNSSGKWSQTSVSTFFIIPPGALFPPNANAGNIAAAECFFDMDPGYGKGSVIPVTNGADVSINNYAVEIDTLSVGVHRFYVRTKNSNGKWSISNIASFYIVQELSLFPANLAISNISSAEYFIDTDPGFEKGTPISISAGADVSASNIAVDISSLANGVHRIYLRTQNEKDQWSITNVSSFYIVPVNFTIPSNPMPGNITKLEYFFDKDPGFGKATTITIPSTTDLSNYNFATDISALKDDSIHTLYIRTFDDWSLTNTQTFVIGTILPVSWISFNAKAIIRNVELNWQTAHETNNDHFDVERSSDGEHFSKIGVVEASTTSSLESDYLFDDQQPLNGVSYYRLRQVDIDGQSTYSIVITVKMNMQLLVKITTNPVHENLVLQISGAGPNALPISIVGISGKRFKLISAVDGRQQINVNDLSAGMYYLVYPLNGSNISIPFNKQ